MFRLTWYSMILAVVVPVFLMTRVAMVVLITSLEKLEAALVQMVLMMLQMEILERTFVHSAARKLKMPTASGRPVLCLHPQRARWQGVVPLPAATLAVLMMLTRAG